MGLVVAPMVPAVAWALVAEWPQLSVERVPIWLLLTAIVGASPAALILGIPAYLLLRRYLRPNLLTISAAGGIIAVIPWLVLTLRNYLRVNCLGMIDAGLSDAAMPILLLKSVF
ncbi:hypothetical protein [Microvirga pakistanensis]|uniref:hypothetical protein n=1 Tax=Microvirga pakistanensis TaxID=1682650 RepID=UPI001069262B|nr:hypothetical protein [Microvirga pakistanensis]